MPSLLEALESKYCSDCHFDENEVSLVGDECNNATPSGSPEKRLFSIFIPRMPPLLSVPELLVLDDCDIDCAGNFDAIKDKCQRVRELHLAQNKLEDWQEVFHILQHMPRIEFLNLSKNRLMGPISPTEAASISSLRNVVLNGTYLSWSHVNVLLENLPVLEELHLSLNNYDRVLIDTAAAIDDDDDDDPAIDAAADTDTHCPCCFSDNSTVEKCKKIAAHKALKTLHFTGNPIENWEEICRLGRVFPHLENFVLADCPIRSLMVDCCKNCCCSDVNDDEHTHTKDINTDSDSNTHKDKHVNTPYRYFPNLMLLNLSCANINTWDDIDLLAQFPKLRNLRVKKWPLWERLDCTEHERRQILIARLPNVALLNGGGVISADEREDAERAFIRHYMDKPVSERPKRYDALIAKHGKLDPLVNINLKPDKRVKVLLTFKEQTHPRLVDINLSVADLKVKLEKIIQLPANKMRLYYLDQDYKEFGPEEMRFPNKLLYSYNIQAGDEVIIDEKK